MSNSQRTHSEAAQKLPQNIEKFSSFNYPAKGCSGSTTPGQVCGPCLQLDTLDATLCVHLAEANKLPRIREEVKKRLNQLHNHVTFQFPVEIISNIFVIYTENSNADFDPQDPTLKHDGPLVLGAVSKSWREIAFGTPQLWNTANILIPFTDNLLPTKVELTKQWLDRSPHRPLYLSLVYRSSKDRVEPKLDSLIPLFKVLRNVAPRWRKLALGFSAKFYRAFLDDLSSAPTLDTLILINGRPYEEAFFDLPYTPSLKHLRISGIPFCYISVELGNLTTLEASCVAGHQFFEVLQHSEWLSSFRVIGLSDIDENMLPTAPFTHSALREWYCHNDDNIYPLDLGTLLDLAVFPSLEKFGYRGSNGTIFPHLALHSLFNRSNCQLTHLELSGDLEEATSDDFISILSDLPTITHLKLEDSCRQCMNEAIMSDELLQRLAPTLSDDEAVRTRLLPRLESLDFLGHKTFSWSSLACLVNTATSDGCSTLGWMTNSIRYIFFTVYHGAGTEFIDTDSIVRFKLAHDAGISINIVNEAPPLCIISLSDSAVDYVYPFDVFP